MKNHIIPYNSKLKEYARQLRENSSLAETLLWQKIKQRALGVPFHHQVPLLDFIVDFYCHELQLAIEIDGDSHEFKYEYDSNIQGKLEKIGITFIRFSDMDVKNNMISVISSIQETINNYLITPEEKITTPLKSLQGDNSIDFSFSKKEKLKSKKLIEQLFEEGNSVTNFPLKLIYLKTDFENGVKLKTGVIAPKKSFKKAVHRNKIKRLLREAYRHNKPIIFNNIEGCFAFMILYLGKEIPDYSFVNEKMKGLLTKFQDTHLYKITSDS